MRGGCRGVDNEADEPSPVAGHSVRENCSDPNFARLALFAVEHIGGLPGVNGLRAHAHAFFQIPASPAATSAAAAFSSTMSRRAPGFR
jgi:hypothetical protein